MSETYFQFIPSDIIEIVVSKLTYESEENFDQVVSGYDRFNVLRLRFPYLSKILKLKRKDFNHNLYKLYVVFSEVDDISIEEYFVYGSLNVHFVYDLNEAIGDVDRRGYNVRPLLPSILLDVYKRLYPAILQKVNSLGLNIDIHRFIIALFVINVNSLIIETLFREDHSVNALDPNYFISPIEDISELLDGFIPRVYFNNITGVLSLLLEMIIEKYDQSGRNVDPHTRAWIRGYTQSYKDLLPIIS